VCEAKGTACRDETVVYRFSPIAGKPTLFLVSADKIVDGKPVNIGTLEFQYGTERHEGKHGGSVCPALPSPDVDLPASVETHQLPTDSSDEAIS